MLKYIIALVFYCFSLFATEQYNEDGLSLMPTISKNSIYSQAITIVNDTTKTPEERVAAFARADTQQLSLTERYAILEKTPTNNNVFVQTISRMLGFLALPNHYRAPLGELHKNKKQNMRIASPRTQEQEMMTNALVNQTIQVIRLGTIDFIAHYLMRFHIDVFTYTQKEALVHTACTLNEYSKIRLLSHMLNMDA